MNGQPAIALSHVSKVYLNGTIALQDMNLNIYPSEFVSLVGPSGCGKSTVLRLIAGLNKMSSGSIQWGDKQIQSKLAFVFQEPALMPWANVKQNVGLPLKFTRVSQKDATKQIEEAIALVGLEGFAQAYPRQLSGGMKMRVSIARALVTKPDILLMDEPFGALDEITRNKLNGDLLTLWGQKQWTVIFVTHNIYEAVYLSNRVIVMAAQPGRVIADVSINTLHARNEEFRTSSIFNEYCRQISLCLSQALPNTFSP